MRNSVQSKWQENVENRAACLKGLNVPTPCKVRHTDVVMYNMDWSGYGSAHWEGQREAERQACQASISDI
jgi:hypothetical protein